MICSPPFVTIQNNRVNIPAGKLLSLSFICFLFCHSNLYAQSDSLPVVLSKNHKDIIESRLRHEAEFRFASLQLPGNGSDWEGYRISLRENIIKKTGIIIHHQLPLEMTALRTLKMEGYSIKNIIFQTRPGVFATANLFVPDGKGPFPAVINMHAHSGRFDDDDQGVAHSLAVNGYVCLSIDPWGAGERTTIHGKEEYHGGSLGASFMNIGETLMGVEISDNMRGVDLLSSLPYVYAARIGATGASGGGNQTMWLAAVDERVKAAIPVVSVGTFESYVMRDNCICETLVDGLDFTEEAGVLALVAPRAIQICNHLQDRAPAFFPSEMLRSFKNAQPVFEMLGVKENIDNKLFDLPHGLLTADREAMLGWFDFHLKGIGTGQPKKENPFQILHEGELMVFPKGERDPRVFTTEQYCKKRGNELRAILLNSRTIDSGQKKSELGTILRMDNIPSIKKVNHYSDEDGWNRFTLETSDRKLIPLLHRAPRVPSSGYVIACNASGKQNISSAFIDELKQKGSGIVLIDLSGTGESISPIGKKYDGDPSFHTLARAELWLGKTMLGEWAKELNSVIAFLASEYNAKKITVDGSKEAGLAALFLSAVGNSTLTGGQMVNSPSLIERITLRDAPVSYLFDKRETVNFFSMAIHVPGFLNWGDVSLAAALSGKEVTFINPLSMSGRKITGSELKQYEMEFAKVRKVCSAGGSIVFK